MSHRCASELRRTWSSRLYLYCHRLLMHESRPVSQLVFQASYTRDQSTESTTSQKRTRQWINISTGILTQLSKIHCGARALLRLEKTKEPSVFHLLPNKLAEV
mgnify:CR=1 FL=1